MDETADDAFCEVDGEDIDTYGGEHYWQCGWPGVIDVDGTLMCENHAGEQGYGPKQEDYGFGPHDGFNPGFPGPARLSKHCHPSPLSKGPEPMTTKPIVLWDVDGVINPDNPDQRPRRLSL